MIGGLTIDTNLDDEEPMVNYSPRSPSRAFAVAKMNLKEQDKGWQSYDEEYHAHLSYATDVGPILCLKSADQLKLYYLQLELAVMSIWNDAFECTLIHANLLSLKGLASCSLYATQKCGVYVQHVEFHLEGSEAENLYNRIVGLKKQAVSPESVVSGLSPMSWETVSSPWDGPFSPFSSPRNY